MSTFLALEARPIPRRFTQNNFATLRIHDGLGAHVSEHAVPAKETHVKPVKSKTRTYHGRVASGRTAGWRGGVGQDRMPTELRA